MKGHDGLVLASDSRGTFGDPRGVTAQNDSMQKAYILSNHVAVLLAGSGEVGSAIVDRVAQKIQQQGLDGLTPVRDVLRQEARACYNDWFSTLQAVANTSVPPNRPDLSFIVAGYEINETRTEQPAIYQLPSSLDFPPMLHNYGFAIAGVPTYALYLLNRLYQTNRTIQDLAGLAAYTITETASQDGKVGGPVQLITISPVDGCVRLDDQAIAHTLAQNEERGKTLRDSFYQVKDAG